MIVRLLSHLCNNVKLGPRDMWFVFKMHHALWFAHCEYEKMCLIWVDKSFVHLSHLVHQFGGKLTHQSKLYESDSTNLFKHIHIWRTTNTYYASCGPSSRVLCAVYFTAVSWKRCQTAYCLLRVFWTPITQFTWNWQH